MGSWCKGLGFNEALVTWFNTKIYQAASQDEVFHNENWSEDNFGIHDHNQVRSAMGLSSEQEVLFSWFNQEKKSYGKW